VSLEIHAILTETLGERAPSYATIKNWVAQFKGGDVSNFFPGRAKELSAPR
jgi:transposase